MQSLKYFILAVLVTECLFHVEGFPSKDSSEERKPSGCYGFFHCGRLFSKDTKSHKSKHTTGTISLESGARKVGSGLASGASMFWNGISVGANGIVKGLGTGTQFTLHGLSKALSAVNPTSLSASLGLSDASKHIAENMMVYNILPKLLMGQASNDGVMNYETSTIFLQSLADLVPQLKQAVDALTTVSYVMKKVKEMQNEGKPIDATTLMREAIDVYFVDVDPAFKKKLIGLSPLVYDAALGDTDAAWHVATTLADKDTVIQALRGMGYKSQIDLIQIVISQVSECARLVHSTAEAAKKKTNKS